jgi:hypothetical protein
VKNEEAVIGGIGNTNFDLWAAGHRPHFYMLGSMACLRSRSASLAHGLAPVALGRRRQLLMQLGSSDDDCDAGAEKSPEW